MEELTTSGTARAGRALTVAGVLIAVFGQVVWWSAAFPGAGSAVKFAILTLGAALAAIGAGVLLAKGAKVPLTPLDAAVAVYVGWVAASAALSPEPLLGMSGMRGYWDGAAHALAAGAIYGAVRVVAGEGPSASRFMRVLACWAGGVTLVLAAAGAARFAGLDPETRFWLSGRLGSLVVQPTFLAGWLATWIVPMAATGVAMTAAGRGRGAAGRWLVGSAALAAVLLAATGSRSGVVALAVAGASYTFLSASRRGLAAGRVAAVMVMLAVTAAGTLAVRGWTPGATGIGDAFAGGTAATRGGAWGIATRAALDHPLTGTGPGTFAYSFRRGLTLEQARVEGFAAAMLDPHNWYLNAAATSGMPAAAAALAIVFLVGRRAFRSRGTPSVRLAAACAALGYFAHLVLTPNATDTFAGALVLAAVGEHVLPGETTSYPAGAWRRWAAALAIVATGVTAAAWGVRSAHAEWVHGTAKSAFDTAGLARATALAPEVSEYGRVWAVTLALSGASAGPGTPEFESALAVARKVAAEHSRDSEAVSTAAQAVSGLARAASSGGDTATADALAEEAYALGAEALSLAPLDAEVLSRYGASAAATGRLGEARRALATLEALVGSADGRVPALRAAIAAAEGGL